MMEEIDDYLDPRDAKRKFTWQYQEDVLTYLAPYRIIDLRGGGVVGEWDGGEFIRPTGRLADMRVPRTLKSERCQDNGGVITRMSHDVERGTTMFEYAMHDWLARDDMAMSRNVAT